MVAFWRCASRLPVTAGGAVQVREQALLVTPDGVVVRRLEEVGLDDEFGEHDVPVGWWSVGRPTLPEMEERRAAERREDGRRQSTQPQLSI